MSGWWTVRTRALREGDNNPGSLAAVFVRHTLVLVGAALVAYLVGRAVPAEGRSAVWLGAAVALGLIAALVARGWLGVIFLLVGAGLGTLLELHLRTNGGPALGDAIADGRGIYLAALAAAVVAYLALTGLLIALRRRRGVLRTDSGSRAKAAN